MEMAARGHNSKVIAVGLHIGNGQENQALLC